MRIALVAFIMPACVMSGGDGKSGTSTTGPTHCGAITADEVWASDMEHQITCDVTVDGGTLTIEEGTSVQVDWLYSLVVGRNGAGALRV